MSSDKLLLNNWLKYLQRTQYKPSKVQQRCMTQNNFITSTISLATSVDKTLIHRKKNCINFKVQGVINLKFFFFFKFRSNKVFLAVMESKDCATIGHCDVNNIKNVKD